jgi:hypothetical protein
MWINTNGRLIVFIFQSLKKLQTPNSKIQGKFKNQTSSQPADGTGWSLMLGFSLDFGDWTLII